MTTRLYYDDSFLTSFDATVVAHSKFGDATSVVLDRTAFYPESGGQLGDRGELGGASILDVQASDDGVVHHLVAPADLERLAVGASVKGSIDRARRRVHMALHTGQHMLSRALEDVASAATVSARLGETACTIDVDRAVLEERAVADAEALVNSVIDDDVEVRAFFPTPEELAAIPLRRAPKVATNVRVVRIGDFDFTPCGGTHCAKSAQVGFVRVDGIEKYKGKARVTFSSGPRARTTMFGQVDVLRGLAREFTCGANDVPVAIEKIRREMLGAKETLGRVRMRLAESMAAEILGRARPGEDYRAVAVIDDANPEMLRAIASKIVAAVPAAVALLAGRSEEGLFTLAVRGASSSFDCGAFLKKVSQAGGGRGGGRAEHAEGKLPLAADWPALVAQLLA